jgi:hypothetical protein
MYGIYNNRRGRRPLCMVFLTTDGAVVPYVWYLKQQTGPSSLMYGIYNNRRAVVPYVWYL